MFRNTPGRDYVFDSGTLFKAGPPELGALATSVIEAAAAEARKRDDNHLGTEHLVLGLFGVADNVARRALESLGITRDIFAAQLAPEPGPSPTGAIPLTPRAQMIVGLAGIEAAGEAVEPEHLLRGVIRESEKWQGSGLPGPHHLRAAARAVGVTLADIEQRLK
jgi:ATP-dependent Clp protease ATP-binding subunit ClpA